MRNTKSKHTAPATAGGGNRTARPIAWLALAAALAALSGCHSAGTKQQNFFTSGSREADQRASQKISKDKQLAESGAGATQTSQSSRKLPLFDRLGGESGISAIVDDVTPRVLQDPRVNWQRTGAKSGGLLSHSKSSTWQATPENVAGLKTHLTQFLCLTTGGPAHYDGRNIQAVHAGMHISNPEFEAAIGDLKATLDRLQVADREQKELLAIVESTRPQIVTVR